MSKVAYLGIEGSFSHVAACEYFGPGSSLRGYDSFAKIFAAVTERETDCGIVPIENTLAGTINDNYFLLGQSELFITDEHGLKIEHSLLVRDPSVAIEQVTTVYSHEKALEQCTQFFKDHDWIEPKKESDTAQAAKRVSEEGNPHIAAIASVDASELYGLSVYKNNIEDNPHNYTRFVVISPEENKSREVKKCSILVEMAHEPGSLYRFMGLLADHDNNLTNILARPIQGLPFEYSFFVDFISNGGREEIDIVLSAIKASVSKLKPLGFYDSWLADGHSIANTSCELQVAD